MSSKIKEIDPNRIPQHIAIIMDGNGRWAKNRGEHRVFGHMSGVESVRNALTAATEVGTKYLTLYAFSTENWNRPKEEVDALMDLLINTISSEIQSLNKNDVRLNAIGDIESLPENCQASLKKAMRETASNTRITLTLALSYSARWEITNAMQLIAKKVESGEIKADQVNEEMINNHMTTSDMPDPCMLIRTSGETRISNFLLWQLAYTELYFTPKFWPEFTKEDYYDAVLDYQSRERRFGKVSEQIQEDNEAS